MTVNDILGTIRGSVICGDVDKRFEGVYVGDLLSRAMSHVESDAIWVTIMSNVNIVAVATLADPACIILSENVEPDADVLARAEQQGVNILATDKATFAVCADLASVL